MKSTIKKMMTIIGLLFYTTLPIMAAPATAATGFTQLEKGGDQAHDTAKGVISKWKWVLVFVPIGATLFYSGKVKDWLASKEENNQTQPQIVKILLIVAAVFMGVLSAFLFFGLVGVTFLNLGFGEAWTLFIVDPWRVLFGIA